LRRALPLVVCIFVLISTLILWRALTTQEGAQIEQKLELQAANLKTELTQQIQGRIFALVRMAKRWENTGQPSQENWVADAQLYLQYFKGYQAIEWVDPSFHVRWIAPLAGNEEAFNFNLALEEKRRKALEIAVTKRQITISNSLNLVQGGKGFIVYVPIIKKEKFEGFIVGVFRYQDLFNNILPENVTQGYELAIFQDKEEIYRRLNPNNQYQPTKSKQISIDLNDSVTWYVKVWTNPKTFATEQSLLPEVVLCTGIVMAMLLAWANHLAQTARRRTQQVETINQGLAQENNERLLAEEALRDSEERYRSVVEQSAEGIFLVDVISRRILEANSAYLNLLGYNSEEILKLTIYDIVYVERVILDERIERTLNEKHLYIRESQHLRQDGSLVYVSISVSLISFRGRKVLCMVVHDLSEHKLAQEALQNSESRLRLALEAAYMGTWDWNFTTNNVECSDQLGPVFGLPRGRYHPTYEEFINSVHPDDREYVEKSVDRAVKERTEYAIEYRVIWPDQTIHWVGSRGQVYCDQTSSFVRMVGVAMDITKRKQVEEQLRWKEALLSSMNSASPLAFYVVDNYTDTILYFNYRFCEIWSIEHLEESMHRGELKNTDIINYCLPMLLDASRFAADFKPPQNVENKAVVEDELSLVDGRTIRRFSTKITNQLDIYFGRLYIFEEITQRKQTEQALQEANQKLRSWVKELEQSTQEITLLNEMSDLLQACLSVEEAHSAIATLVQPLFPNISGGVFTISSSRQIVEAMAIWGTQLASQKMFAPHDCWALRRGRSHWIAESKIGLRCQHLHPEIACAESLCVPMMAQGEALGLLYLSTHQVGQLSEAKQRLAVTVAEHIALALANLTLRETLQKQSIRDPLTGLFNRRYLEESLLREIHRAERKQQSLGIIMLDVDHFKRFNDTFGHEAGDTVLRELGLFLRKNIRQSDIACRYGGEELTLILPESSLEATIQRAQQIREGVKLLQVQHRRQLLGSITISLGVACFPDHGLTGDAVIRAADQALYQAKAKGRDRVTVAN
jgi:diguanylate cyclase (GGDEF)-like protein/PAS domain S-box-containing protein